MAVPKPHAALLLCWVQEICPSADVLQERSLRVGPGSNTRQPAHWRLKDRGWKGRFSLLSLTIANHPRRCRSVIRLESLPARKAFLSSIMKNSAFQICSEEDCCSSQQISIIAEAHADFRKSSRCEFCRSAPPKFLSFFFFFGFVWSASLMQRWPSQPRLFRPEGSVSMLSLYTSPSLPNISFGISTASSPISVSTDCPHVLHERKSSAMHRCSDSAMLGVSSSESTLVPVCDHRSVTCGLR